MRKARFGMARAWLEDTGGVRYRFCSDAISAKISSDFSVMLYMYGLLYMYRSTSDESPAKPGSVLSMLSRRSKVSSDESPEKTPSGSSASLLLLRFRILRDESPTKIPSGNFASCFLCRSSVFVQDVRLPLPRYKVEFRMANLISPHVTTSWASATLHTSAAISVFICFAAESPVPRE